jgi:hypothetical protein
VWPEQQDVLFAIGVAVTGPSLAVFFGAPLRWVLGIGLGGAIALWLMLTATSSSDDPDITKTEYAVVWAGAVVVWFAVWSVASLLAAALRKERTR